MKTRIKAHSAFLLTVILTSSVAFAGTESSMPNFLMKELKENDASASRRICIDKNVDWFPGNIHHRIARKQIERHADNNQKVMSLFDTLVSQWAYHSLDQSADYPIGLLIEACVVSSIYHTGQVRKDAEKTPYIFHPLTVCHNLWHEGGVRNPNILIAAILHDTIEDTEATFESIASYFGRRVAETVEELSNDPSLDTTDNKQRQINHAPFMSQDARLVKLADRLANVRDLNPPPPAWNEEKVEAYREWGRKLLQALRNTNAGLEKALEQELET